MTCNAREGGAEVGNKNGPGTTKEPKEPNTQKGAGTKNWPGTKKGTKNWPGTNGKAKVGLLCSARTKGFRWACGCVCWVTGHEGVD